LPLTCRLLSLALLLAAVAALVKCGDGGPLPPLSHPLTFMSAEQEAKAREILFADETVRAITEGRQLNVDYWVFFQKLLVEDRSSSREGSVVALAMMYFDPPISYEGEAPREKNPCLGHDAGPDESFEDEPCSREATEYETEYVAWSSVNEMRVAVHLDLERVVDFLDSYLPPEELREVVQYGIEVATQTAMESPVAP